MPSAQETTAAAIISVYVNGRLSHSGAKSALKALGITADHAEAILSEAWSPASSRQSAEQAAYAAEAAHYGSGK
jgi:hypothetical protein